MTGANTRKAFMERRVRFTL